MHTILRLLWVVSLGTVLCKSNANEIQRMSRISRYLGEFERDFISNEISHDISGHLLFKLRAKYRFGSAIYRSCLAKYRCWSARNRLVLKKYRHLSVKYRCNSTIYHWRSRSIVAVQQKVVRSLRRLRVRLQDAEKV